VIERGRLVVCSQCAQFSNVSWDPKRPKARTRRGRRQRGQIPRPRSEVEAMEQMELVEDYGVLIRKTRQRKGLTVEDFAKKIMEKESVVKKLEKEQLNPPSKLVRKIERELGIKIMEASTPQRGTMLTRPVGARTLGEMIKIKDSLKENEEEED
jgi:putative transcription factor